MGNKSLKYVFVIYFVIILIANLECMIWANYQGLQYKNQEKEKIEFVNSSIKLEVTTKKSTADALKEMNDSNDKTLGLLKPFMDTGKKAESATPVYIIEICGGLFCFCITFLPSMIKKAIDKWVIDHGYNELDWGVIVKYEKGVFVTNLLVIFFQFIDAKDFMEFSSKIASAFT